MAHPIFGYDPLESMTSILTLREYARYEHKMLWDGSVEVLSPALFKYCSGSGNSPSIELTADALQLFDTYYHLREILYYSYNFPASIEWSFRSKTSVNISFKDQSIPLQLWHDHNQWTVRSHFALKEVDSDATYKLVKELEDQFKLSNKWERAFDRCMLEAKAKVNAYYSFLPDNLVFTNYSISDFKTIYQILTARALLARYFAAKHWRSSSSRVSSSITLKVKEFENALRSDTGIPMAKIRAILRDLTYDRRKAEMGFHVDMFPLLYDERQECYWLFPHMFALSNCFRSLRRLWAKEDPSRYGKIVSMAVDRAFSDRLERSFIDSGFKNTRSRVKVSDYAPGLPDIDLLVVSIEPGDMYAIQICELKNPVPEDSAKEFVASAGKKGHITKAKEQVKRLQTLDPLKFRELMMRTFPALKFGQGVYALSYLVVTSENLGMLAPGERTTVVDYETVESVLRVAKGDVLGLLKLLDKKEWEKEARQRFKVVYLSRVVGETKVKLPTVAIKGLLSFEKWI